MNFKIKKYITWYAILLLLIILIAIFFRFYNIPNRYGFDYDPTRDTLIVSYAAESLQFPLIGPPSGIGPFTFGPWYYYQLILFKIIFPVDYAPWIYIGILSTVSVFVMYKIGVLLGGRKLGLLLSVLSAVSPAETGQIRALSNPTLIPLHATLVIWIFVKFIKENPPLWMAFLWGLILGIGINNHYQMIGLLPFPIILFAYKKSKRWIRILTFTVGMFVAFIPLLIFNYFHGWSTVKGLIFYLTQGKDSLYIPNRWLFYIRDFWPAFWSYVLGVPVAFGIFLIFYIGVGISYLIIKKKLSLLYIFLIVTSVINIILLRNFSHREYYYLLYLHPLIFILFGLVIWHGFYFKFGKYISSIILMVVFIGMISQSVQRLGTATDQMQFKAEARAIINNYPNKKFVLYECSSSQKNRVRGVVFFLNNYQKISESGIKIAYPNEKCSLPINGRSPVRYLHDINIINISYASEDLLNKYGWNMITPRTVFKQLFNQN